MQGALLATLLKPIYISHLVVGEIKGCVASLGGEGWEQIVQNEVHRAIGGRIAQGVCDGQSSLSSSLVRYLALTTRPIHT